LGSWVVIWKDQIYFNTSLQPPTLRFNGSICGWEPNCNDDETGSSLNAYVCAMNITNYNALNLGQIVSIVEIGDPSLSTSLNSQEEALLGTGLVMEYNGGTIDPSDGDACWTKLELRCDPSDALLNGPSDSVGSPIIQPPFNTNLFATQCGVNLLWKTRFACPLCSPDDVAYEDSDCKSGKSLRRYFWKNPYCFRGASLPTGGEVPCSSIVSVTKTTFVVAIVIGFILLGAALTVVVFLWWKNKRLYADYHQLRGSNLPMESLQENNFTIADDDDDDASPNIKQ